MDIKIYVGLLTLAIVLIQSGYYGRRKKARQVLYYWTYLQLNWNQYGAGSNEGEYAEVALDILLDGMISEVIILGESTSVTATESVLQFNFGLQNAEGFRNIVYNDGTDDYYDDNLARLAKISSEVALAYYLPIDCEFMIVDGANKAFKITKFMRHPVKIGDQYKMCVDWSPMNNAAVFTGGTTHLLCQIKQVIDPYK